jgi:hypothetical protein
MIWKDNRFLPSMLPLALWDTQGFREPEPMLPNSETCLQFSRLDHIVPEVLPTKSANLPCIAFSAGQKPGRRGGLTVVRDRPGWWASFWTYWALNFWPHDCSHWKGLAALQETLPHQKSCVRTEVTDSWRFSQVREDMGSTCLFSPSCHGERHLGQCGNRLRKGPKSKEREIWKFQPLNFLCRNTWPGWGGGLS